MKKRLLFPLIVVLFLLALCPVALASSNDISLPEYGLTLTLPDGYYLVTREGISEKIPEEQKAFFTAQYEALLQGTEIFYASAGEGGPSWSCGYIEDAESGRKPYTKMMQGELEEELDRVAAGGEVLDISEYVTDNFAFLRFFIDEGDAQSMHYRTIVLGHEYELIYRAEGEMSARDRERTEWLIDTVSFMPVGGAQESEGEPEAETFEPEVYNPAPQDIPAQTADPGFSPRESAAAKQATLS